jgi:hypothetical protein
MVMPLVVKDIAAAVGVLIVMLAATSVIGTLIVPRPVVSKVTRQIDRLVNVGFLSLTKRVKEYSWRDRVESTHAATLLLCQLAVWLVLFFVGFSLLLWPLVGSITAAFHTAGPALWEIGNDHARGAAEQTIIDIASITGIITVTLQIAYLPTLYSAFNRRETDVALLNARAGVPSWGPELLARTHYALGTGVSTLDTLPDLYETWERWAADVGESHTTYLPLVRFRSPRPLSSWVTGLLAVLDSAALIMAISPEVARQYSVEVPARLCLRSGFLCFREVARAMGFDIPEEPDPAGGISLSYEEFLDAIERLRRVDFPIKRTAEEAWPDFAGWRINYEQAAYAIAREVEAVPALWSGPRRHEDYPAIPPVRPPEGRMSKKKSGARTEGALTKSSAVGPDGPTTKNSDAGSDGPTTKDGDAGSDGRTADDS